MQLTHYIVVRRDLPLGIALASVAHAAGESFYTYAVNQFPRSVMSTAPLEQVSVQSRPGEPSNSPSGVMSTSAVTVAGACSKQAMGSNVSETIAIVLGARNMQRLAKLGHGLMAHNIPHVPIVETDGEYAGQLMAIGLLPAPRDEVYDHLREYHMLSELDWEE